jgi:hypothetical protein
VESINGGKFLDFKKASAPCSNFISFESKWLVLGWVVSMSLFGTLSSKQNSLSDSFWMLKIRLNVCPVLSLTMNSQVYLPSFLPCTDCSRHSRRNMHTEW